jgi:hypothetical protein
MLFAELYFTAETLRAQREKILCDLCASAVNILETV